jgi:F-type H+-transporting ATPase subunit b
MKSGGLPQLDVTSFPSQLFWLAVTFVVLYLVMARSIVPNIHTVLETRRLRIANDLDTAAKMKADASAAKETYESGLQNARNQSQTMLAEVTSTIKRNADEKSRELETMLAAKMTEAEKQISKATETAMSNLVPVASEVSSMILETLMHKKVDASAVSAAVQKLSKEVA